MSKICDLCNKVHPAPGVICQNCGACFTDCSRSFGCKFAGSNLEAITEPTSQGTRLPVTSMNENNKIRDSFLSWLASTKQVTIKSIHSDLWTEFSHFLFDSLKAVDKNCIYLLTVIAESGAPKVKVLDSEKLFVNQDGVYYHVDENVHELIGKNVAVMPGLAATRKSG